MKDSLLEILMNFFEKTLTQIKETNQEVKSTDPLISADAETNDKELIESHLFLQRQAKTSQRVFTPIEQFKLTKASYQYLVRIMRLDIIAPETMEEILHQLLISESPFVTVLETKWAIRAVLASRITDPKEAAFIDMLLASKDEASLPH